MGGGERRGRPGGSVGETGRPPSPHRKWWALGSLALAVSVVVLTVALVNRSSPSPAVSALPSAPPVSATLYQGADVLGGERVSLADLTRLGKPVVLNFYAGACPPCRAEMPEFQRFYEERGDEVLIFGLDVGPYVGLGTAEEGKVLLRELGVSYPAGLAEGSSAVSAYGLSSMPSTYFITADGRLFRGWSGVLTRGKLDEIVDEMLALTGGG